MSDAPSGQPAPAPKSLVRRFLPLLVLAGIGAAIFASGLHRKLSLETLFASHAQLESLIRDHLPLTVLAYAGIYMTVVAASLPGASLLTLAGGFLFGPLLGASTTVVAATAGGTILFLIARSSLGASLGTRFGDAVAKFRRGIEQDTVWYLLFLRLTPIFPFFVVNIALALIGIRLWTFVWTTFIGIAPGTLAYSFAGAGLDGLAASQKQAYQACLAAGGQDCRLHITPSQLVNKELILALAGLGLIALLPVVLRVWMRRKRPS